MAKAAQNYQVVRIGEKNLDDTVSKQKAKDTIFEAVNQVVKYIVYSIIKAEETIVPRYYTKGVYALFNLYYPVIVYDGPLYNGYLKDDEIELEEKNHIVLQHRFQPPYMDTPKTFLIDVVKKEYLEEFIQILKAEHTEIQNSLNKDKT